MTPQAAYDAALTQEGHVFDRLLADLCSTIQEPAYKGNGRPPLPLHEQTFCAVQKVYSQMSSRRAKSLHDNARDHGHIPHSPSFVAPSRFLNREDASVILLELIRRSSAPLAGLEQDFAVDSTGFRTTGFMPYCQDKHKGGRRHTYLKLHAISGVRTNIVTDVVVTQSHGTGSNDSINFPALVRATAERFQVHEVSADKAYSGKANHWAVKELGGQALIPFKDGKSKPSTSTSSGAYQNASGLPGSAKLWRKAFHYFQAHRDEFDQRYHKRSNVEATFSAIKRKFGDALKSRNLIAQKNELLCKVLAYNLTVVIMAASVLDIPLPALKQNSPSVKV